MKKIIFLFILAFFLFVQSPLYIQYNVSELEGLFNENSSYMDIKSTGNIENVKEFSKAVSEFCSQEDAFVATLSYTMQPDREEITELFVAGNNVPDFLKRKGLTDNVISKTHNSNDITDIKLPLFNPSKMCVVQNFDELKDKSLSRTYYVSPAEKGISFQRHLTENYDVDFFTSDELLYIHTGYMDQIPGVALMMAALLVFFAFWIITQYQLNAVKKLYGYSDRKNMLSMFGQFAFLGLCAIVVSLVLQFAFCSIYNKWESYWNILIDSIRICAPVFAVLLVLGLVFLFLFYSSDVKYALKGRRPYKVLNSCAVILKVITIVFLCSSIVNIGSGMKQTNDILKQDESFQKVSNCRFTAIRLTSGSSDYMSQFETAGSSFYKALDGILMSDHRMSSYRFGSQNPDDVMSNTVFINYDYLKVNPIYDFSGVPINIEEKSIKPNEAIVLVPEKYKNQENEIYKSFYDWYHSARYVTIPTTELPLEERKVSIKLIFVKDNQSYFAFNTDEIELRYNYIEDPFAVIVTKNNMDNSYYSNYICNSEYLLFENDDQPLDKITNFASSTGVSEDLVNVPTVNSAIDNLMQQCKNQIAFSIMFLLLTILIVIIISIYIVKNFIDEHKKLFFTKKMLGYSMFSIYGKFIILITISQLAVFFILKTALNIPWDLWGITSGSFLIVDFIIMWITALKYQKTLTKGVLKGEEL